MKLVLQIFALIFFLLFSSESSATLLTKEATYYADSFIGSHTSNGNIFSQDGFTAAACDIPLGKNIYVFSDQTGAIVRVNDRPNCARYPNILDLTSRSFSLFAPLSRGRIASLQVNSLETLDPYIFHNLSIELAPGTASVYFAGDGSIFQGKVTDGKRSVMMFLQNQSTKEEFSRLYEVSRDGTFSFVVHFPSQSGIYTLVIASGNSFKTETTGTITLIASETPIISAKLPIVTTRLSPRIDLMGKTPNISFGDRIYAHLTLNQDTKTFQTSGNRLVFDMLSFFHPGRANVRVDGYEFGDGGPLDRIQIAPSIFSGTVMLDRTHEKTGQNLVSIRNNKQSTNLKFRVPSMPRIRWSYFLTLPDGDVREFDYASETIGADTFLIPGKVITLSLPTIDTGTYQIEAVQEDGIAYFNLPITRGQVWNILEPYPPESPQAVQTDSGKVISMIISHINTIRASLGRNLLIVDPVYSTLAQAKVNDMIARDYHAHRDPDGLYVRSLAEKIGLDIRWTFSENIAYGEGNLWVSLLQDGLEESGSHRFAMLLPRYSKIGVAYARSGKKVYLVHIIGE